MSDLTVISTYYRSVKMLPRQLELIRSYSKFLRKNIHFIFIDDGSPIPDHAVIPEIEANVSLYRIAENIPYHNDGAKNLGAYLCDTEWMLLKDIDYLINTDAMAKVRDLIDDTKRTFYNFRAHSIRKGKDHYRHPKSCLLLKCDDFWRVHGYDEDLCCNIGKSNLTMPRRLQENGFDMIAIDDPTFEQVMPTESDDVEYRGDKDPNWVSDRAINNKLFADKFAGRVPWSKDTLRFNWTKMESWRYNG